MSLPALSPRSAAPNSIPLWEIILTDLGGRNIVDIIEDIEGNPRLEIKASSLIGFDFRDLQINMREINLSDKALTGANFENLNLSWSLFSKAMLAGVNFRGANLSGVNFEGADLSGANFHGANLSSADLTGAEITGANFHGAKLYRTIMRGITRVRGANFLDAEIHEVDITGSNLRGASNFVGTVFNDGILYLVNEGWKISTLTPPRPIIFPKLIIPGKPPYTMSEPKNSLIGAAPNSNDLLAHQIARMRAASEAERKNPVGPSEGRPLTETLTSGNGAQQAETEDKTPIGQLTATDPAGEDPLHPKAGQPETKKDNGYRRGPKEHKQKMAIDLLVNGLLEGKSAEELRLLPGLKHYTDKTYERYVRKARKIIRELSS